MERTSFFNKVSACSTAGARSRAVSLAHDEELSLVATTLPRNSPTSNINIPQVRSLI